MKILEFFMSLKTPKFNPKINNTTNATCNVIMKKEIMSPLLRSIMLCSVMMFMMSGNTYAKFIKIQPSFVSSNYKKPGVARFFDDIQNSLVVVISEHNSKTVLLATTKHQDSNTVFLKEDYIIFDCPDNYKIKITILNIDLFNHDLLLEEILTIQPQNINIFEDYAFRNPQTGTDVRLKISLPDDDIPKKYNYYTTGTYIEKMQCMERPFAKVLAEGNGNKAFMSSPSNNSSSSDSLDNINNWKVGDIFYFDEKIKFRTKLHKQNYITSRVCEITDVDISERIVYFKVKDVGVNNTFWISIDQIIGNNNSEFYKLLNIFKEANNGSEGSIDLYSDLWELVKSKKMIKIRKK